MSARKDPGEVEVPWRSPYERQPAVDGMSVIGRDDREAVRALRAEWDHAVPSAGGPSPYASWLERQVVRSRRQASGAVSALAKADGEVTALAVALRAAGVAPTTVQAIIDSAPPRGQ